MLPTLLSSDADPQAVATLRTIIEGNDPRGIAAALRAMAQRPDSTALLKEIAVPTLVVVGAQDALTPPSEAQALQSSIAGSTLVELPNSGHISNVEQPDAFTQAVQAFLNNL
jgi:3-oxoadipate enol-lactonase